MLPQISLLEEQTNQLKAATSIQNFSDIAKSIGADLFMKQVQTTDIAYTNEAIQAITQGLYPELTGDKNTFYAILSDAYQFVRAVVVLEIGNVSVLQLESPEIMLIQGIENMASLFDALYTQLVTKQSDPAYHIATYLQDFPVQTKRIVAELRSLTDALVLHDMDMEITDYLSSLADYYENDDPMHVAHQVVALDDLLPTMQEKLSLQHKTIKIGEDTIIAPGLSLTKDALFGSGIYLEK